MIRWFHKIPLRLRSLLRRDRVETELAEEVRFHLQELTAAKRAQGMTAEEARYAALRELGGVEQIKEECRDMRRVNFIESFLQDVRYGLRQLRRNPGFTAVAVLTLALGIGANTAVFSVVDAVLLRPLTYAQPDLLVSVQARDPRHPASRAPLSYPNFFDFRKQNHVFDHMVTYRGNQFTLTGSGQPSHLDGAMVTWDLFPLLGVQPALGRGFLPPEETAGTHVAVLSHEFWQKQFGGDRNIVGRSITLNQQPYTVIGVAPVGFVFPPDDPAAIQLWTTIAPDAEAPPGSQPITEQRGAFVLPAMARLKPGVTIDQARAQLDVIASALARQYPDDNTNVAATYLQPELERLTGVTRQPLLILLGAVGLVLLIACANIANLLLARTASREHEMAVRTAIGASRRRVIRQLLTESLMLGILGGAAGILLSVYALQVVLPLGGRSIPRLATASIDGRVLGFSLILAFLTSILFGMAPALQASKIDLTVSLKEGTRGSASGHERLRGALVVAQIAVGLVLMSGAGLLIASFLNLENSHLGMRTDHLLTFWFNLPATQYNETQQVNLYDRLLERMRSIPGVESVAGVWPLPLGGDDAKVSFNIEERPAGPANRPVANMAFVTPGYFSTAGIPLLKGRFFTDRDDAKAPPVLIVNKAFADKFFPGEDPVGKRIEPAANSGAGGTKMHHRGRGRKYQALRAQHGGRALLLFFVQAASLATTARCCAHDGVATQHRICRSRADGGARPAASGVSGENHGGSALAPGG